MNVIVGKEFVRDAKGVNCFTEEVEGEIDGSESVHWKMWEKEENSGRVHMALHETCKGEPRFIRKGCGLHF